MAMKWLMCMSLSLLCALLAVSPTVGQQSSIVLKMEQVMTPEDLRGSGVSGLTQSQRAVLDVWLNKYTLRVLTTVSSSGSLGRSAAYGGVGSGHWIKEKSDNGGFVTLEDGSLWEINAVDRVDTALWLPITDITVISSRDPIGDFKYELIDTEDGERLWQSSWECNNKVNCLRGRTSRRYLALLWLQFEAQAR